jgi:hypothetical protein
MGVGVLRRERGYFSPWITAGQGGTFKPNQVKGLPQKPEEKKAFREREVTFFHG